MEFCSPILKELLGVEVFPQVNVSEPNQDIFLGMHLQAHPFSQGKLVTCLAGSIIDSVLDVEAGSESFNQHLEVSHSGEDSRALFKP